MREGPSSKREMEQSRKAMQVIYLRAILAQSIPTRGEANAYVKHPIARQYPTLSLSIHF